MIPVFNFDGIYINGLRTVCLFRSDGRKGYSGDGFAMFSYNCQPLGWIHDGQYLIECVTADLLMSGKLTPQWEGVPTGLRLIHPRYTLAVKQTLNGWLPSISDELIGRSHSLKERGTCTEAVKVLDILLRRRVGREKPSSEQWQWHGAYQESDESQRFQLARDLIGPDIAALIRNDHIKSDHWTGQRLETAKKLANLLAPFYSWGIDELPRLATILATYIKFTLIDVYRGANSGVATARGFGVSIKELAAFRNRFKHTPMTDEEYLDFVQKRFISPLQSHRRKSRPQKTGFQLLRPRRDRDDYPIVWPFPAGTRLFDVEQVARGKRIAYPSRREGGDQTTC